MTRSKGNSAFYDNLEKVEHWMKQHGKEPTGTHNAKLAVWLKNLRRLIKQPEYRDKHEGQIELLKQIGIDILHHSPNRKTADMPRSKENLSRSTNNQPRFPPLRTTTTTAAANIGSTNPNTNTNSVLAATTENLQHSSSPLRKKQRKNQEEENTNRKPNMGNNASRHNNNYRFGASICAATI